MSEATEQRKLAAIMFTDMVAYSALAQRDDKLALELLEEHRELLREIFPRFHGTEIKTIGDAFLIEFNSALEAAQCAIEIQRALGHRNHDVAAERRIELKIGIHIGDVVHRAGDVYGDGVNIASRIERLAGAGGICISMDVERQIRNAVETRFEKLAPTELKNISVPMELFRIVLPWEQKSEVKHQRPDVSKSPVILHYGKSVLIGALVLLLIIAVGWWFAHRTGKSTSAPRESSSAARPQAAIVPEKSIAVLPFDNLSSDKENAYFAEGIQDEILTRLAKVADLKVIARTSTQKFESAPENLPDIAKQLGVANILEGSVQKVNDQVRVNVQLINALTSAHIWAEIYDRKLTDIFAVESDIAKTIAETLQAKLTGSEKNAMASAPTEDVVAHELYLKGRHFWGLRGENLLRAVEFYNQAIARDPNYALAYAGLGETYILLPYYTGADPIEARPKARTAALKALELSPNLAEAHDALGKIVYTDDIDLQQAIREHRRAIELSPNNASAHHWMGNGPLAGLGRLDEAIAEGQRSVELDPLSVINLVDLADTYMYAHRFKEAEAVMKKALEIDPAFAYAHWIYGMILQVSGDLEGARAQYATARMRENDQQAIALRGQLGAMMGRREEASQALATLEELGKHQYVESYYRALLYISLGQKDAAISALEQSYAERDGDDIGVIKVDPLLDPLRSDPRFEALVQKVIAPKTQQK